MKTIGKIAAKFSKNNRIKKYNLFINYFNPTIDTSILDVGAAEEEYSENDNMLEKKYPYPENITVLGIDKYEDFLIRYPKVKTVTYDGNIFPLKDKAFDICWSNAVLEHVGSEENQKKFLKEIQRVSKTSFITTPNRHFPFEVHTKIFLLHFLPKTFFDKILKLLGKSWATGAYMNLLSLREIKELLETCDISRYTIIKNKIFCFTVDFVIVF